MTGFTSFIKKFFLAYYAKTLAYGQPHSNHISCLIVLYFFVNFLFAMLVGILRIMSNNHFFEDVFVGAISGLTIGTCASGLIGMIGRDIMKSEDSPVNLIIFWFFMDFNEIYKYYLKFLYLSSGWKFYTIKVVQTQN